MSKTQFRKQIKQSHAQSAYQRILAKMPWYLIFPILIEKKFHQYYSETFISQMRAAIVMGFALLTICALLDLAFAPSLELKVLTRIVTVLPILVLLAVFAFSDRFKKHQQPTLIIFTLLIFIDITWIAYGLDQPYEDLYYNGVVLIEIFLLAAARIRFFYSCFLIVLFYIIYTTVIIFDNPKQYYDIVMYNFLFIAAASLGLFGNYTMERTVRRAFLQQELIRLDNDSLENGRDALQSVAKYDVLTMLANQGYFYDCLELEWRRALRYQYPLTLALIDIDLFKSYRQAHGKAMSDLLLQKVAAILKHLGRRPGDIAAYLGDDKFALLLVGTDKLGAEHLCCQLKERLQLNAIPNSESSVSPCVTVSIGAHSMIPVQSLTCNELIKKADKSLFEAKKTDINQQVISDNA